jgi:hypothetical protein
MISSLVRRMHHDFRYELSTGQRSGLVAYATFSATIVAVRVLTTAIRGGRLRAHDIIIRGVHVHHFLPFIALLTTAGAFGVRGSDRPSGRKIFPRPLASSSGFFIRLRTAPAGRLRPGPAAS